MVWRPLAAFATALFFVACGSEAIERQDASPPESFRATSEVVPDDVPLAADGTSAFEFRLVLQDGAGHPLAGVALALDVTGGGNTVGGDTATGPDGKATLTLASTRAETKFVRLFGFVDGMPEELVPGSYVVFAANAPGTLSFRDVPAEVRAGERFEVAVATIDAQGNAAGDDAEVALELEGGGLLGTTTAQVVRGVARFPSLRIERKVEGARLIAHVEGLAPVASSAIRVRAAGPQTLAWVQQPTDTVAGAILPVEVDVLDAFGNPIEDRETVRIERTDGGPLVGKHTVRVEAGKASFDDLYIPFVGSYSLVATLESGVVAPATTEPFAIAPAAPEAYDSRLNSRPSNYVRVGETVELVASVRDDFGNPIAGLELAFAASGAGNEFLPASTATTDAEGVAVVSFRSTVPEVKAVSATAGTFVLTSEVTFVHSPPDRDFVRIDGGGQTGIVGTALENPVVVTLVDEFGNLARAGVAIPASASHGGVVTPAEPTIDEEGRVTVAWQLGTAAGPQELALHVPGWDEPLLVSATALPGPATQLAVVQGEGQQGQVGAALALPLQVRAADAFGNPAAGVEVAFEALDAGGSLAPAVAVTGADGVAATTFTLGTVAGPQAAVASIPGVDPVRIEALALAGPASSLRIVSGDGQSGAVDTDAAAPLVVAVEDAFGNGVPDIAVAFTATAGTVAPAGVRSGADGLAQAALHFPQQSGAVEVTAGAAGLDAVRFAATALPGPPASVRAVSGAGDVGAGATRELAVEVADAFGNAAPGIRVDFTVAEGGGAVTAAATTDATGTATATLQAGTAAGALRVDATVAGLAPATFALTVLPGAPAHLSAVGAPQTVAAGTDAAPWRVRLTDAWNNPIAGQAIDFAVLSGPGTLDVASVPTDAAGEAAVVLHATGPVGTIVARATAAGLLADFALPVVAGPAARLEVAGGDQQSGRVGQPLAAPLAARLVDAHGNGVASAPVTFAVASGSGTLATLTSSTDEHGVAATGFTPTAPGAFAVDASAAGFTVRFSGSASGDTLTAAIGDEALVLDGRPGPHVYVQLRNASSQPVAGVPVGFQVTSGTGNAYAFFGTTTEEGWASAALQGIAGPVTVTASTAGASTEFHVASYTPVNSIACLAFAGQLQPFGGGTIVHYRTGVNRFFADSTGKIDVQVRWTAPPAGLPTALSVADAVGLRLRDPSSGTTRDVIIGGDGTLRVDGVVTPMAPGVGIGGPGYFVEQETAARWHVEYFVDGSVSDHVWLTTSRGQISSLIADAAFVPGVGGTRGVCGRNDDSDDSANFTAELPLVGAESIF